MAKKKKKAKKPKWDAFSAAMQRNPVYANEDNRVANRTCLRKTFAEEACKIITDSRYKTRKVKDDEHVNNIEKLRARVTKRCGRFLKKRKLRFGTAQKYLNVELKRRWLDEKYSEPPHCPFDRYVINVLRHNLEDGVCTSWTQCDSRKGYEAWVKALRYTIGAKKSLAKWERDFWGG